MSSWKSYFAVSAVITALGAVIGVACVFPSFTSSLPVAMAPTTVPINQTPKNVKDSEPVGSVDAQESLDLSIHLALRDEGSLDDFLARVSDPASPDFGHYMTHAEFAAKHLPTQEQLKAAADAFEARGLKVDHNFHGGVIKARTTVAKAEHALGAHLRRYHDPRNPRRYIRAPEIPLRLPAGLKIVAVHGFASAPERRSMIAMGHKPSPEPDPPSYYPPSPPAAYSAATVRAAYMMPAQATGTGQTVGMIELDGYKASDIAAYAKASGVGLPALTNVLMDGYSGGVIDSGAQLEVTLDIELAMAAAPGLKEIVVFSADQQTSDSAFFDLWNEIANPTQGRPILSTISCSWGTPEDAMSPAALNSEHSLFKQMAAQGQSVFVAAGDSGAYDDGQTLSVDDPASQRWTIAVGGTRLSVGSSGQWASESTWSSGGGGISGAWRSPAWQVTAKTKGNQANDSLRNVPDVSLNADPDTGYAVLMNGGWTAVGGTSCAAPFWAGYWADVQQARVAAGKKPLGFAAPLLWALGPAHLRDIADGSNNGYYRAVQGFDNATGWGSLDGNKLLPALVSLQ